MAMGIGNAKEIRIRNAMKFMWASCFSSGGGVALALGSETRHHIILMQANIYNDETDMRSDVRFHCFELKLD